MRCCCLIRAVAPTATAAARAATIATAAAAATTADRPGRRLSRHLHGDLGPFQLVAVEEVAGRMCRVGVLQTTECKEPVSNESTRRAAVYMSSARSCQGFV